MNSGLGIVVDDDNGRPPDRVHEQSATLFACKFKVRNHESVNYQTTSKTNKNCPYICFTICLISVIEKY